MMLSCVVLYAHWWSVLAVLPSLCPNGDVRTHQVTIIILFKIPHAKQLLISVDFVVEQSAWGRSAAAAHKQKRAITMAPSITLGLFVGEEPAIKLMWSGANHEAKSEWLRIAELGV